MTLILIPSGEFTMGSPVSEKDHRDDEKQHRVRITKPFYLGETTVTQNQYERLWGSNPSHFKGDGQLPVEQVSWEEAVEFCKKLSAKEGKQYQLPTEAQWEYACRAGSAARSYFGEDASVADHAWYAENSSDKTHPVKQKKPNAFGLYDMYGNVYQWCSDYHAEYESAPLQVDPNGPATNPADKTSPLPGLINSRIVRGSSYSTYDFKSRSANREDGSA